MLSPCCQCAVGLCLLCVWPPLGFLHVCYCFWSGQESVGETRDIVADSSALWRCGPSYEVCGNACCCPGGSKYSKRLGSCIVGAIDGSDRYWLCNEGTHACAEFCCCNNSAAVYSTRLSRCCLGDECDGIEESQTWHGDHYLGMHRCGTLWCCDAGKQHSRRLQGCVFGIVEGSHRFWTCPANSQICGEYCCCDRNTSYSARAHKCLSGIVPGSERFWFCGESSEACGEYCCCKSGKINSAQSCDLAKLANGRVEGHADNGLYVSREVILAFVALIVAFAASSCNDGSRTQCMPTRERRLETVRIFSRLPAGMRCKVLSFCDVHTVCLVGTIGRKFHACAGVKAAAEALHANPVSMRALRVHAFKALASGRESSVRLLLSLRVSPYVRGVAGSILPLELSLFQLAVYDGSAALVRHMLQMRADPCAPQPETGHTPLHMACCNHAPPQVGRHKSVTNARDVACLLLGALADVNAQSLDGSLPLHQAAREAQNYLYTEKEDNPCLAVARLLRESGADLEALNNQGRSAFDEQWERPCFTLPQPYSANAAAMLRVLGTEAMIKAAFRNQGLS
eukprot:TRINITY_DN74961_c0_g1_i1.p1 TRINITY_DN74961_c0_g1~~TRINITY_DN74961_c0_g1_i1.p1  ORF type:complete len:569 (-),score=26.43 TRINITY_DN74961_c0_g1_i1:94-1800(-)